MKYYPIDESDERKSLRRKLYPHMEKFAAGELSFGKVSMFSGGKHNISWLPKFMKNWEKFKNFVSGKEEENVKIIKLYKIQFKFVDPKLSFRFVIQKNFDLFLDNLD